MAVKKILVQTCLIIVVANFSHSYVLLAANLDDFRSIAKKFIPDKLADQLTDMATKNSDKYVPKLPDFQRENVKYRQRIPDTKDHQPVHENREHIEQQTKTRFAIKDQSQTLDFEELVEKVRQKLKNEQSEKYKITQNDYDDNAHETAVYQESGQMEPEMTQKEYIEQAKEKDGTFFNEADLTKLNDSYEDYVTPSRDNIFESDETARDLKIGRTTKQQRFKSERDRNIEHQRVPNKESLEQRFSKKERIKQPQRIDAERGTMFKDKRLNVAYNKDVSEETQETHVSEEVKAKTETLFDDRGHKPKNLKGTMIPTRYYYKMSSPNYYKKLPVVAEKYDFDEPLPEKDREYENITYFENPPASINKRVKLKN